jgi:hypothetical protein
MTTGRKERYTPPGAPPTDEDLRLDAELTRAELADTVAELAAKADVKTRARAAAQRRLAALHEATVATTERTQHLIRLVRSQPVAAAVTASALAATVAATIILLRR